jgi:hypothetical protein
MLGWVALTGLAATGNCWCLLKKTYPLMING